MLSLHQSNNPSLLPSVSASTVASLQSSQSGTPVQSTISTPMPSLFGTPIISAPLAPSEASDAPAVSPRSGEKIGETPTTTNIFGEPFVLLPASMDDAIKSKESPEKIFSSWPSDIQLSMVRRLRNNPKLNDELEKVFCDNEKQFAMFYSNPKHAQHPLLKVELELNALLNKTFFKLHEIILSPVTSIDTIKLNLEKYEPAIVCFTGHAEINQIFLCDDENRALPVSYSKFREAIKSSYSNRKPKLILLFGCYTYGFYKNIEENTDKWFDDITIIGWKTLAEDSIAQSFGVRLLEKISKVKSFTSEEFTPVNINKIFDNVFQEIGEQIEKNNSNFGDPEEQLNDWKLHLELYCNICNEYFENEKTHKKLSEWRNPAFFNPILDMRRMIPECHHCRPSVVGIPFCKTVEYL